MNKKFKIQDIIEQGIFNEKILERNVKYDFQIVLSQNILIKLNSKLAHNAIGLESKLKRKLRTIKKYRHIKI